MIEALLLIKNPNDFTNTSFKVQRRKNELLKEPIVIMLIKLAMPQIQLQKQHTNYTKNSNNNKPSSMALILRKVGIGRPPTHQKKIKRVSDTGLQQRTKNFYILENKHKHI